MLEPLGFLSVHTMVPQLPLITAHAWVLTGGKGRTSSGAPQGSRQATGDHARQGRVSRTLSEGKCLA